MIKILLLMANSWAVLCDQDPYPGPVRRPVVWSSGMGYYSTEYHVDFKNCLDRRSKFDYGEEPYKGANCALPSFNEFTDEDVKESYDLLEGFRTWVWQGTEKRGNPGPQPAAKLSFPIMQYDKDLALDAWRWARECLPGRDPCTLLKNSVGQTTITVWSPWREEISLAKIWHMWYDEVDHFDRKLVDNFNPDPVTLQKIGNFSQLVWGQTQKFGCAKSFGTNGTMYSTTLVCNFWPQGNVIGEPVYLVDKNWKHV